MLPAIITFIWFAFDRISFSDEQSLFKHRYLNLKNEFVQHGPLPSTMKAKWYVQRVDHFNPMDVRTWKQYYYRDDSFYKRGGPVYLWIGGEGRAEPVRMNKGYWQSHGRKNKAMLFMVEHRYYGSSYPFRNTTITNLPYLTTQQALADLSAFIVSMNAKHEFPVDTKWIVFGASYAGNLAAWMRLKYPHLVYGAVASSAPLLAQFDFPEYFDITSYVLESHSKQCRDDIRRANEKLDELVQTAHGRKEIGDKFKLCSPLRDSRMDVALFLTSMSDYICVTVQYDRWGKDVKEICDKMLENANKEEPIVRYSKLMDKFMDKYSEPCLKTRFKEYAKFLKKEDLVSSEITFRSWIYQTCTEYGYYATSRKDQPNIFSKRTALNFYTNVCSNVFGLSFDKNFISVGVNVTNRFFGGITFDVPRVVFIHGSTDPWHPLGIISVEKKRNVDVIYIKGGSHCSDLDSQSNDGPKEATAAQIKILSILDSWLK